MSSSSTEAPMGEIVSQSEIERLLAQVGSEDLALAGGDSADDAEARQNELHRPYSFRKLSSFSPFELRKLRVRHEEFIRSLAARLSNHLRMELSLQMSKLEMLQFGKFVDELSNPTFLGFLRVEPLSGVCFLDIPPKLGLAIVDREVGGAGICPEEGRGLSELEARLLSRVIEIMASEWCSFWSDMLDLRSVLIGYENNPTFVQTCPPDTNMLVLSIEARLGDTIDQIQFGFPRRTLEPLLLKLNTSLKMNDEKAGGGAGGSLKWNEALDDIMVQVTLEIPDAEMTARAVAQLQPGDFIPIRQESAGGVNVSLAKEPIFVASLGTCNAKWAAKILHRTPATP